VWLTNCSRRARCTESYAKFVKRVSTEITNPTLNPPFVQYPKDRGGTLALHDRTWRLLMISHKLSELLITKRKTSRTNYYGEKAGLKPP
jgi:hypothetical protein